MLHSLKPAKLKMFWVRALWQRNEMKAKLAFAVLPGPTGQLESTWHWFLSTLRIAKTYYFVMLYAQWRLIFSFNVVFSLICALIAKVLNDRVRWNKTASCGKWTYSFLFVRQQSQFLSKPAESPELKTYSFNDNWKNLSVSRDWVIFSLTYLVIIVSFQSLHPWD